MSLIKKLKMHFFPPSSRSFLAFVYEQKKQMAELKEKVEQQEHCLKKIYDSIGELSGKLGDVSSKHSIADLCKMIENNFWQINYNKLLRGVQKSISTAFLHQKSFAGYKNKYAGRTVVLCGAGPTLNYYEPIEGAIHVAANRAFLYDKVKFDYIFAQDFRGIAHVQQELIEYKGNHCIKFFGTQNYCHETEIPESLAISCNAVRFDNDGYSTIFDYGQNKTTWEFAFDISALPLGNFTSITFSAMQFILYTHPEKIYVVGCDNAPTGHFNNKNLSRDEVLKAENLFRINLEQDKRMEQWDELKNFAKVYYPETKIISINPIGLKGIFEDMYTDRYLADNQKNIK